MKARLGVACVAFVSLFILAMCIASATWKPEYAQNSPEVQKWFSTQHNAKGEWCCNESDGHRFYGTYNFQPDGSIIAIDNGMEYVIKAEYVLRGHNPTGAAVWWFLDLPDGRRTYCFSPGSLS